MGIAWESIFVVLGGLGLLLFGMKMMSTGLQIVAGDHLQTILKRATSNRFLAVLVGIVVTICINSSTAVTIITVGFVNSGLMTLVQAIGVIMGANVGTTFSAQLIAFKIDTIAPLFIFVGILFYLFIKNRKMRDIGYVVLGFGILLFSISIMGGPLKEFAEQPSFNAVLSAFENPVAALLAGFLFTAIIQSSSATMGLLVTMHLSGVPISFETSAFIILGTNIGTSTTTVIASIPANRESKRAALFHIMYDVIGSIVFGTIIYLFPSILAWFQATWKESARQVAMFHTLYNISTLVLLLPFIKWIALLMQKIVPMKQVEANHTYEKKLLYLDAKKMPTRALAVENAKLEVFRMGKIACENLKLSMDAFFEKSTEKAGKILENERVVDYLNKNIAKMLVEINKMALSQADAEEIGKMFKLLTDIERIGDHAENIAEYVDEMQSENLKFSEVAKHELRQLGELTVKIIYDALAAYEQKDKMQVPQLKKLEAEIDELSIEMVKNHINRLMTESCEPRSGVIFTDMIIDLERTADHAINIAQMVES